MASSIQLNLSNNTLNISINIAELLNKGSINISLNNQVNAQVEAQVEAQVNTYIPVAEVITMRKKKRKPTLLILDEFDEQESPLLLCKEVSLKENKEEKKKYISHKYERAQDGMLKCPYCDCKKKNLSTISMHVAVNHASEMGKDVNPHRCEYPNCSRSFPIKTRLQHHIKTHHEIDSLCCPFPKCEYTDSKIKQTLYTHYVRKHMNYEKMCTGNTCNTCGSVKPTGIIYHLATCNRNSPFCKSINSD